MYFIFERSARRAKKVATKVKIINNPIFILERIKRHENIIIP